MKGRPKKLFYLPELRSTEDFIAPVSAQQCDYITENYLHLAESKVFEMGVGFFELGVKFLNWE